jgi:hypothetical protein
MELKLGKLPKRNDPRTLMFARYLNVANLPIIPKSVDYSAGITDWGMMLNDKIGDCAIAGPGHLIEAWTVGAKIIPDSEILKTYSAISGYDPLTGRNDSGCVLLDVLNFWRNKGIMDDKIGAFAEVDIKDENDIKAAIYLFNGLNIGVAIPESAEQQFSKGQPWKVVKNSNIVGGHCIILVGFDSKYYYAVTWGKVVKIEKAWLKKYMDEAWAIISQDYIFNGKTKQGFLSDQLIEDLKLIA